MTIMATSHPAPLAHLLGLVVAHDRECSGRNAVQRRHPVGHGEKFVQGGSITGRSPGPILRPGVRVK